MRNRLIISSHHPQAPNARRRARAVRHRQATYRHHLHSVDVTQITRQITYQRHGWFWLGGVRGADRAVWNVAAAAQAVRRALRACTCVEATTRCARPAPPRAAPMAWGWPGERRRGVRRGAARGPRVRLRPRQVRPDHPALLVPQLLGRRVRPHRRRAERLRGAARRRRAGSWAPRRCSLTSSGRGAPRSMTGWAGVWLPAATPPEHSTHASRPALPSSARPGKGEVPRVSRPAPGRAAPASPPARARCAPTPRVCRPVTSAGGRRASIRRRARARFRTPRGSGSQVSRPGAARERRSRHPGQEGPSMLSPQVSDHIDCIVAAAPPPTAERLTALAAIIQTRLGGDW